MSQDNQFDSAAAARRQRRCSSVGRDCSRQSFGTRAIPGSRIRGQARILGSLLAPCWPHAADRRSWTGFFAALAKDRRRAARFDVHWASLSLRTNDVHANASIAIARAISSQTRGMSAPLSAPHAQPVFLLAPMEGLLDARLRAVITSASRYDWCVTEFVRVTNTVLPTRCA